MRPKPRLAPDVLRNAPWPCFWDHVQSQLRGTGLQTGTRRVYRQVLRTFRAHLDATEPGGEPSRPASATPERTRAFFHQMAERERSWSSIATHIGVLRTIFDKLGGLALTTDMRTPKRPQRLYDVLSPAEAGQLQRAAGSTRDRLMIGLMVGGGLKVGEVCALRVADVDQARGILTVRFSGETRRREVPLPDSARVLLASETLFRQPADFLFAGAKPGGALSVRTVERVVQRAARKAGLIKVVTPMSLRHSFAVQSLRDGMAERELQETLGHQWIDTTLAYRRYIVPSHVISPADRLSPDVLERRSVSTPATARQELARGP
ncbi:MAG: tyrosine-type recombinase/integrase [Verrucomicrobia bacterium]|nr:tyrosine-type recombinase/integrase [Verrucomicrobiota bacterium]